MKNILIINGHPAQESLSKSISQQYREWATTYWHTIRYINITDLRIEDTLRFSHKKWAQIPSELEQCREDIDWAEHIVFIHPVWWSSMPAMMKWFIDIVFWPGFAYTYTKDSPMPKKLLSEKTARIIITFDTPYILYRYFYHQPSVIQLRDRILWFCWIKTTWVTYLWSVRTKKEADIKKFLMKIKELWKKWI